MKQRGSIPMAVLILIGLFVVVIIGMAMCGDALFEDEDEANDLGWVPAAELSDDDDYGDRNKNRNGNDCNGNRGECSDDDQVSVTICAVPDSCRFG